MELSLLKPRHSLAHILAQAVQQTIDPLVSLWTGPAVDDGFYYDMLFSDGISVTLELLKDITKTMQGIAKQGQDFVLYTAADQQEALQIIALMGGHPDAASESADTISPARFKRELTEKFATAAASANTTPTYTFYLNTISAVAADKLLAHTLPAYTTLYTPLNEYFQDKTGEVTRTDEEGVISTATVNFSDKRITFIDLCEWPHVDTTKQIADGSFVLERIAGAYRQAKESNPQLTRLYGLAFATKDELKAHQTMMEEAKKRDHRIIGKQMKLFTISELVGSWLPLFQPNGMIIRKELEDYLRSLHKDHGYSRVWTPHIAKEDLYNTSGHAKHYLDDMFKVHGGTSNEDFYLKPMNCPHHMQLFADNLFSYRDMPIRYFEPATVYRDEKTGQLSGLTRVRAITQDDGHLFCRIGQLKAEITTIVHIIKQFYTTMQMMDGYRVSLSIRGDEKEKYLGGDDVRHIAESSLKEICTELNLNYKEIPGEAAFYGPKLDFMFKDAIGREHQLATAKDLSSSTVQSEAHSKDVWAWW
jgi:threonyl-tRNA synthetase